MKIKTLLETTTPSSTPIGNNPSSAPKFGRNPEVLEDDKIEETTTSGAVATVSQPVGSLQKRGGNIFSGIKTSKKFPNSIAVKEEEINEQDLIINPISKKGPKPGFHKKDLLRQDHEVEMARSDLVSANKNSKKIYELIKDLTESDGIEGWVQEKIIKANDYLNSVREYLENKEIDKLQKFSTKSVAEGIRVVDQDYDLDQMILTLDIEGKKVSFTYWDYDENFANAERRDVFDQLQEQPWYARLDHPTRMEILDAAYRAIRGLEPQEYRPTVRDDPLDEQGVAEGEKKPHPKTWHDVDPKLGKAVDKMSQAEKVKKGLAHPDTLKKKGVAEGSETNKYKVVVKGQKRSYSVWVEAKNEEVAIIRAQQYVAREHNDHGTRAAVVDMKQGVAEGFSDIVKGVKRAVKGKEHPEVVASKHFGRVLGHYNQGSLPDAEKETKRYNKVQSMYKGIKTLPYPLKEQGVAEGFLGDRTFNCVMPMVKRIASEVSDYDRDEFGEELWSLLDQKYGSKFAQSVLQDDLDFYWNEYTELTGKDIVEGSAQDKLHKRHQELRKKSGLPDPNYYKELKATFDLPDEERYKKAAELKKKYNVKETENNDIDVTEDLKKWFREKWVRFNPQGKIMGPCARGDDSEGKPKCLPQSKAHSLGKKGRASAAARKRREDPNPERSGPAINVATKKKSNEGVAEGEHPKTWHDVDPKLGKQVDKMSQAEKVSKGFAHSDTLKKKTSFIQKLDAKLQQLGYTPTQEGNVYRWTSPTRQFVEVEHNTEDPGWYGWAEGQVTRSGKLNYSSSGNDSAKDIVAIFKSGGVFRKQGVAEGHEMCPECGGAMYSEEMINEKKDACYYKVKSRYKVWPSAYASGALVQCRKKGAKNWGSKSK